VYDETIRVLKAGVSRAKLGNDDKLSAIQRLDAQARALEGQVDGPSFDEHVQRERQMSRAFDGKTVARTD
jgi:hypothetical protein